MNTKVKKLLLTEGKFMSEMHFKYPGFLYIAWKPFTKTKRKFKNLK